MDKPNILEDCPFCGSGNVFVLEIDFPDKVFWPVCRDCGAQQHAADSYEKAVRNWNRRALKDGSLYQKAFENGYNEALEAMRVVFDRRNKHEDRTGE